MIGVTQLAREIVVAASGPVAEAVASVRMLGLAKIVAPAGNFARNAVSAAASLISTGASSAWIMPFGPATGA
jgi:hypothetical protein